MDDIFKYSDYQKYLNDWIESKPRKGRGIKLDLAKFLGITPGHVSKILNQDIHLTPDQAAKLISYLDLSEIEGKYFLSLVEMARAGSVELREIIRDRLDGFKKEWYTPSRLGLQKKAYTSKDLETYFSSYLYSAIELITYLKKYQTPVAISEYFNLPKKRVLEILSFLVKMGTVEKKGDKFINPGKPIWYEKNKNIEKTVTTMWKNRSLASLDYDEDVNFHSIVNFTIDKNRIYDFKKKLVESIMEIDKEFLNKDPSDTICSFCIDLFEIK